MIRRLKDVKGDGNIDTVYVFKGNALVRKETNTNGDSYIDLRVFYENGQRLRQEADTNGDHRVDVWVFYKDAKRVRQDEDRNYNGRIDARYFYQDDKVIGQERVAEAEPTPQPNPFTTTQKALSRPDQVHGGELEKEKRVVETVQKPVSDLRVQ